MVGTISNDHIRLTILAIIKSPLTFKVFSYLSTTIVHVPPISFLSHYVVNIVRCSFPPLFYPLSYSLPFVFGALFVSFSVIMKGSMSKEKAE